MRRILGLMAAAALTSGASAANLVTNGDFEAGNSDFTSDYAYTPAANFTEGQYTVRTNPFPWNPNFVSAADHTSGAGNMLVVNGSPTAGDIVWESGLIALTPGQNYFFEAFVMNVCCGGGPINPPILTFSVILDGGPPMDLNTAFTPNVNGVWTGISNSFNSGAATTARLFLINANTIRSGNDFAIDDINLDTKSIVLPGVPEPASWALMIAGLGLVGRSMRARTKPAYRAA
ncbi:MAG: PEPxxWA-CTERM sorting domain-containing protein [Sphingobium sp.]|nr:PEPxxWA-CTERM sorting domain-containing protein [Sphingobium sp.]